MIALYVTDLHGDINKYEKTLKIANDNQIKYIINGGDMFPKSKESVLKQEDFINNYLNDYFQRLSDNNINYLCILGNDDLGMYDELFNNLCEKYNNIYNIANKKITIDNFEFIGMNYVLDYPFRIKDRVVIEDDFCFNEQIGSPIYTNNNRFIKINDWETFATQNLNIMRKILNDLPIPKDTNKTIYVMHMPPANLGLDKIENPNASIGSKEIYKFIEQNKPMLTLHGHIHESPNMGEKIWINHVNKTDCIQPGQSETDEENFVYVVMDLNKKKYERFDE